MFFTTKITNTNKDDDSDRFVIEDSMNIVEIDANVLSSMLESMIPVDDTLSYVSEGAASWEAMKLIFTMSKKNTKELWSAGKKLEKDGKYADAVKKYDAAITEAKKLYKVVDSIPDENIYDFLVGFIPFISYALWGIVAIGSFSNNDSIKIKGASRSYARKQVDIFIKDLTKKRNKCASKK